MSFSRRFKDSRIITICMMILLALWGLYREITVQPPSRPRPAAPVVEEVDFSALPALDSPGPELALAVRRSISRLSRMEPQRAFRWKAGSISAGDILDSLKRFEQLLEQGLEPAEFRKRLASGFRLLRVMRCDGSQDALRLPVLVTGYFQPELPASPMKTGEFVYPLYGVPSDMLRVDLRRFDSRLPNRRLLGRLEGRDVVPYYSREEIDSGSVQIDAPVLAWLSSPVDGLMLHIQGSGLLKFPDGEERYIHFAESNGHPYGSIGKWLIRKGFLEPSEADWPGIKKWAARHPDVFRQALAANPRYIFFKWEKEGPVGSLGTVLVPMHSVALDQSCFPPGVLCFLNIPGEPAAGSKRWSYRGFVLNQDSGSAIKGPCRVDLYCGHGDKAGRIAGSLRHRGELFIILKKD